MLKYLGILIVGIVTSFYYFPFFFKAFPAQNTKNMMALIGLILFAVQICTRRMSIFSKDYIQMFALALVFSLVVSFSITYNATYDMAYARFIVSVSLWMSAAFLVCSVIRFTHGHVDVELLCKYLMAVCVVQCVMALVIDTIPAVKSFVNSYIEQGQTFLDSNNVNRLYGIGASLDVAGSRFSAVLVLIATLLFRKSNDNRIISLLLLAFLIISIVGNMIARTTTVGMMLGLLFIIYKLHANGYKYRRMIYWICALSILVIPVLGYIYNHDANFERLVKFGFEGFISIIEKGEWYTTSNETLTNMIVFPDNIKTWIIGDGYFDDPFATDPYYTGEHAGGFYKGTDIGYLRFIFYCGLAGLIVLIAYSFKITQICIRRFVNYKTMFLLLLAINLIVWLKVSTDIFLVFALFLCIPKEDNENITNQLL